MTNCEKVREAAKNVSEGWAKNSSNAGELFDALDDALSLPPCREGELLERLRDSQNQLVALMLWAREVGDETFIVDCQDEVKEVVAKNLPFLSSPPRSPEEAK